MTVLPHKEDDDQARHQLLRPLPSLSLSVVCSVGPSQSHHVLIVFLAARCVEYTFVNVSCELEEPPPTKTTHISWLIITPKATREEALPCGGCTSLYILGDVLREAGENVTFYYIVPGSVENHVVNCSIAGDMNRTIVVLPESYDYKCRPKPLVSVRWIMQPMGRQFPSWYSLFWDQDEWIYHYAIEASFWSARPIPWGNLLLAQRNPYPNDEFDPAR